MVFLCVNVYIEPLKEAAYDTEDDKTCPIYVDFNELKAYNDEVVDWSQILILISEYRRT